MNKELQDKAWVSLPEDFKKEVKEYYQTLSIRADSLCLMGKEYMLKHLFGVHNLTSKEETKELNLCELLKDCCGMTFYSPLLGNCKLKCINTNDNSITIESGDEWVILPASGRKEGGELMIMPSKDTRTWDKWKSLMKRWKPKEDDTIHYIIIDCDSTKSDSYSAEYSSKYNGKYPCGINEFHTEEQAKEAAKRVTELLKKYHEEIGE